MQYFAGVDPSITNTGIVVLNDRMEVVEARESSSEIKKSVIRSTNALRLKLLRQYLQNTLEAYSELCVAYEHYSFQSVNKAFSLGELGGVYKLALFELTESEPYLVPPGKLKQFAVGTGAASKEAMVEQASKEGFQYCESHDLVDAYFLAKFCMYLILPREAVKLDTYRNLVRNRLTITQKEK